MSAPHPELPLTHPLPPVRPQLVELPHDAQLEIVADVPADASTRREAVRDSALYFIGGRLLTPTGFLTGYVGLSAALHTSRAATSFTNWVIAQRKILPAGMGLLRTPRPTPPDQLRFIEARVIQLLSTDLGMLALTNTQTAAQIAAARLTRDQVLTGQQLADQIAHHLWTHVLAGRTNPWPAPAPNTREQAVRVVLRAGQLERRALDVEEIAARLLRLGHTTTGRTFEYSVRRDLEQREPSRGRPRILSVWHRRHRLFHDARLPRRIALAGYDLAHPPRRARPRPAQPVPRTRPAGRPLTGRPGGRPPGAAGPQGGAK